MNVSVSSSGVVLHLAVVDLTVLAEIDLYKLVDELETELLRMGLKAMGSSSLLNPQ